MSISFTPDYKIHCDALVTGYTDGIRFMPDGTIYCRNVATGYSYIRFGTDYTIYCNDIVLTLPEAILNQFRVDTTATTLTFV